MENKCQNCQHGHTLRIHILTGDRNCEAGKHNPSGPCKDFNPVDLCPKCGKQITPEDTLTSDDDEIFYHVDCDNPHMKIQLGAEVKTMPEKTIEEFTKIAVQIQDASNIVAVTGELREAMIAARTAGIDPRKSIAVMGIFFKVFDMMGAPSTTEMYEALTACENGGKS